MLRENPVLNDNLSGIFSYWNKLDDRTLIFTTESFVFKSLKRIKLGLLLSFLIKFIRQLKVASCLLVVLRVILP